LLELKIYNNGQVGFQKLNKKYGYKPVVIPALRC